MAIEVITTKGFCHARIDGEMTIYTAAQIRQSILEQCHTQKGMGLDLENVTEIDMTGVQLLLALRKHLDGTDSGLQIKKPSVAVEEALKMTRLTETFEAEGQ